MSQTNGSKPTTPRFCHRCGRSDGEVRFRSRGAYKCEDCDQMKRAERDGYHRLYAKARVRAVRRLITAHKEEFGRYMVEARRKVARQARQQQRDSQEQVSSAA